MTIALAADHGGFELKEALKPWFETQGYMLKDFGAFRLDPADDYPDYGIPAAQWIAESPTERRGIFICRNGQGLAMVANKVSGVRALLVDHPGDFFMDEAANGLVLAGDYLSVDQAKQAIEHWFYLLGQPLDDRHQRRIHKIEQLEQGGPVADRSRNIDE
jgi:ribose 5-phosphate isomerase B